jgi:thiol-disulfide isomerase/thioredoxin
MMTLRARLLAASLLMLAASSVRALGIGDPAPAIEARHWLNAPARVAHDLGGKVVLVEFWTYGCVNCRNVEPYIKQWYRRYANQGLVVIGVHTPEFDHERSLGNVAAYVRESGIGYPVALDDDHANWNRYQNRYWPAIYLRDRKGVIRYMHFGEGRYRESEAAIRQLLAEK